MATAAWRMRSTGGNRPVGKPFVVIGGGGGGAAVLSSVFLSYCRFSPTAPLKRHDRDDGAKTTSPYRAISLLAFGPGGKSLARARTGKERVSEWESERERMRGTE